MQIRHYLAALGIILSPLIVCCQQKQKFVISGTVRDAKTGETLTGATIGFISPAGPGIVTNSYGYYSITMPESDYKVVISYSGYLTDTINVQLHANTVLNRTLSAASRQLEEVVVSGKRNSNQNILRAPVGVQRLNMEDIKNIPVLFGEKDVLKTIQLLPGIKSAGDGRSGFYVRGGGADQNLILLDEATVYNASHLLGFFSIFNSDAIKDIAVYKGGMPASYGGRLASVEDIKMKDGNNQHLGVSGGIGLIASRLNVEGPIDKGKGSFIVSARRTYADAFTGLASDTNVKGSKLYFYDINLKGNYKLGTKNRIFLSGYFGKDFLHLKNADGIDWANTTGTFRWNHIFNEKLFSNTSFIYSNYNYNTEFVNGASGIRVSSAITDYHVKEDINYYLNPRSKFDFGFDLSYHITQPGQAVTTAASKYNNVTLQKKYSLESALYASHEWTVSPKLKLNYGIRLTALSILGPGDVFTYDDAGLPVTDTRYGSGKFIKTYINPEPRIAASYQLNEKTSVKFALDRNVQNIHLLNNSTAASPTNVYLPTSNIVQPEVADQISAGYYGNFPERGYEFSTEVYYKTMQKQVDYKNGAELIGNNNVESELLFGKGRGWGWENYIKKKSGRLTGWISYTYSRTERQIAGINSGKWYPSAQDQTHSLSIVGIYQASRKWNLSATWVYNTGNAVTFPSGKYGVDGVPVYYYSGRNADRLPAYHRLDLGATVITRKTARTERSWTFSLYNAYGHDNPFIISFQKDPVNPIKTRVQQTTLFKMVPSVTYNFKF